MDIAETCLLRMGTGLSGLVLIETVEEAILVAGVDPKLVVGLGKQQPVVKGRSTVMGGVHPAVRYPVDQLHGCQGVSEPKEVFCW